MPATSEAQRKLAGIALAIKRGKLKSSYSSKAANMSKSMSEDELHKYASKSSGFMRGHK